MAFTADEAFSSSTSASSWTYHVFLSFRGEDTRKGFTDHLCASLERKGIKTFRDDKDLERGEVISLELMKAIEESMFAITVLSANYAFSTWCLDELQKIVECKKSLGLVVMPVFYDVDPSDVRHQRGSFEEAFRKHEDKFGQDSEKVANWRYTLGEVASYSGWDCMDRHQATLVESIAEDIHKKLIPKLPSCTENLVGIASRVENVCSLIGMGLNDIRFIGIWGMGGIGKTTIARAVYEAIRGEFKASCFLANIGEASETNGLVHIQKELVSHLHITRSDFCNLYDGKNTIKNSLSRKRVLLVLDDISELSQLENLAGNKDWFGPGSRVIITTRDMHLLRMHGVHGTYKVGSFVHTEALQLFCLKAFKQDQPQEGYMDLSEQVVDYTKGLPLALEVLGSYLYGRTTDVWHSALKQIISIPHPKIHDTLEISYNGLHAMEKNLFLDIACFFKGRDKDKVIDILEKCGQFPRIGIEVLIERSLVTLDHKTNKLDMHDLLQEMGRNIVFQESPNPGKRSRLWSQEDIDNVLTRNEGTEAIQSIVMNLRQSYEAHWSIKAFFKISQLKFLSLGYMRLPHGLSCLPNSLKVLHWRGCPLKILPLTDQQYEVVDIKLHDSKLKQLWHGIKFLEKLKYMDLSFSNNLEHLPDFSGVPNLEKIVLKSCINLTRVHPSLVQLKRLVLLNFEGCKSLKALPSRLEMSSLKSLILDECFEFKILPEFGERMEHLSVLSLKGTAIRKLPTSLGCLVSLAILNLEDCENLVCLPNAIGGLTSLELLNISGCSKLNRLPEGLKEMMCLDKIYASFTARKVNKLSFTGCKGLVFGLVNLSLSLKWPFGFHQTPIGLRLPPSVLGLNSLTHIDLRWCNITEASFPHDFCHLPSLKNLDLSGNNFVRIPSFSKLSKLECLRLSWCQKLQLLPELPSSLRHLEAINCVSMETSRFNPCSLFASLGNYCLEGSNLPSKKFDMLIGGHEVPSWFVAQEDDRYVSIPHDCPLNERVGIVLCFLLASYAGPHEMSSHRIECSLAGTTGFIDTKTIPFVEHGVPLLYILGLVDDYFPDDLNEDDHDSQLNFVLTIKCFSLVSLKTRGCGGRLVRKQDIEHLNKSIQQIH